MGARLVKKDSKIQGTLDPNLDLKSQKLDFPAFYLRGLKCISAQKNEPVLLQKAILFGCQVAEIIKNFLT